MKTPESRTWLKLFWLFLKVNTLSTSGPASIGLLYKEAIVETMTESEFIEAVGFSNVLPGSEALKLAMFVGYSAGGMSGMSAALLGSILPPTLLMLAAVSMLEKVQGKIWLTNFIDGMTPAVAMLMLMIGWKIFRNDITKAIKKRTVLIAALSLAALLLNIPSPFVLIGAGILGVVLLR
ncbi:MAG: chromate transporter [Anaerolineales bacterium]|uniref:Chromate transporter n=1 Tax=Candidatus Desulfolinea nitratireducens TaxID=2841698 RepID=A0A8J6TDL6_9CHLR|nr:chromate transporter [Candidatus Desulfolinea nitratireducens]